MTKNLWNVMPILFCLAAASYQGGSLYAQSSSTAALTVTTTDSSGAVIPGATVVATSVATNQARTETTGTNGSLTFSVLPVGVYRVQISASGFKTVEIPDITLEVTETRTIIQKLEVGTQQQEVTVSAEVSTIQTDSSSLGSVTGERTIESVPLSTRNFTQIMSLSPGVVQDVSNASQFGHGSQDFYANGNTNDSNNFQLDGVFIDNYPSGVAQDSTGYYGGITIPNPDAIQEFKVQTSTFDAGYGRNSGSNVNVVTKSGTNQLHASLFEFFRNEKLDANDFFSNRSGLPRGELRQNQFGGTVGGPIRKDKLFYFLSYQGTRQVNGIASQGYQTAFLPPQLTNDRSAATLGREFCPANNPAGSPYANTFGGGTQVACDGSNINPIALSILNYKLPGGNYYIPSPQTIQNAGTPQAIGFSAFTSPATFTEDQAIGNLDYLLSSKHSLALRYIYGDDPYTLGFNCTPCLPGAGTSFLQGNTNAIAKVTSAFSNTLINEAHFSYFFVKAKTNPLDPLTAQTVGLPQYNSWQSIAPILNFTGLFNIGGGGTDGNKSSQKYFEWADQISKSLGRQTIRAGYTGEHIVWPWYNLSGARGSLTFQTFPDFLLGLSAAQNGSTFSNLYASSAGIIQPGGTFHDLRVNYSGLFVQDDIKVSSTLTVNLGMRWEYDGLPYDVTGFWPMVWPSLLTNIPPATGTYAGWTVANNFKGTVPNGVFVRPTNAHENTPPLHDFAPRVGFAWQPFGNTGRFVVRGGYGWFFDRIHGNLDVQSAGGPPVGAGTTSGTGTSNALATEANYVNPVPATGFPSFLITPTSKQSATIVDPNIVPPLVQNYNMNLQYEVKQGLVVEMGYVGSRGERIQTVGYINEPMLASPTNPVNCGAPVGCITTNTAANAAQRVPYLGFLPNSLSVRGNQGDTWYNSLQTLVRKSFSHGLQFQAAYTFGKNLSDITGLARSTQTSGGAINSNDPNNYRQQWGPSDYNRLHRLVVTYHYELPTVHNNSGFEGRLLSGWSWSGVTTIQSGLPITLTDSRGGLVYGSAGASRAQICPGMTYSDLVTSGSLESRLNNYFNLNAICPVPIVGAINGVGGATGYGNTGRGILTGPNQLNFDTSISKAIRVPGMNENSNLQFRTEFFNVFNHTQFSNPATNVGTTGAGVISSTSVAARIIQFALKYNF